MSLSKYYTARNSVHLEPANRYSKHNQCKMQCARQTRAPHSRLQSLFAKWAFRRAFEVRTRKRCVSLIFCVSPKFCCSSSICNIHDNALWQSLPWRKKETCLKTRLHGPPILCNHFLIDFSTNLKWPGQSCTAVGLGNVVIELLGYIILYFKFKVPVNWQRP